MAQKYKNISIFSWYTPGQFVAKSDRREGHFKQPKSDSGFLSQSSYTPIEEFQVTRPLQEHGNVPMLRCPKKGMVPYQADTEILKSCDVMFPLRINLLGARDLARKLVDKAINVDKGDELVLRAITYCAPFEPVNSDVMNLLAQIQNTSPNPQFQQPLAMKNLVDPFGNQGTNKGYHQGWNDMRFKLDRTLTKKEMEEEIEKKKSRGVF